ncbi:hypothetical protein PLUTE_b0071 [Pseudoalteromonas luteoviolacea DSM 6061]|nr:hypothetical protein [Pseudoalteromonas luteoviolacea DSM 6061]
MSWNFNVKRLATSKIQGRTTDNKIANYVNILFLIAAFKV